MSKESAILSIIAAECGAACKDEPDLIKRIKKAMAPVANGHWMSLDEDTNIRGAIAAVLLSPETTEDDKKRIEFTFSQIRALAALTSGVPVNMAAVAANPEEIKPISLVSLWHEVKAAT